MQGVHQKRTIIETRYHLNPPQISPNTSSFLAAGWVAVVNAPNGSEAGTGAAAGAGAPHTAFVLNICCCGIAAAAGVPHTLDCAGIAGAAVHPDEVPHIPVPLFPIMLVGCGGCTDCCCCGAPHCAAWFPNWPKPPGATAAATGAVEKSDRMSCFTSFFGSAGAATGGAWKSSVKRSFSGALGGGAGCTAGAGAAAGCGAGTRPVGLFT